MRFAAALPGSRGLWVGEAVADDNGRLPGLAQSAAAGRLLSRSPVPPAGEKRSCPAGAAPVLEDTGRTRMLVLPSRLYRQSLSQGPSPAEQLPGSLLPTARPWKRLLVVWNWELCSSITSRTENSVWAELLFRASFITDLEGLVLALSPAQSRALPARPLRSAPGSRYGRLRGAAVPRGCLALAEAAAASAVSTRSGKTCFLNRQGFYSNS